MFTDIYTTDKKYQIIYADPPWTYTSKGKGAPSRHYNCMKKKELQALPVPELSDTDCILFLWVTFPVLEEGLELIKKWGFKYKTCGFTWVKRNKIANSYFSGMGHWTMANAEICLIGIKGKPKRIARDIKQICDARVREHSRKPDEIRERIVALMGDIPRIELFARQTFKGWDCWGNETTKFNSDIDKEITVSK